MTDQPALFPVDRRAVGCAGSAPRESERPLNRIMIIPATLTICFLIPLWAKTADASTVNQARAEVRRLWGPYAPRMLCVISRESGWNPRAVSRTGDHGLVQLNARTWRSYFGRRWELVYDPVANVRMGYVVWRRSGFSAWTTARWC